MFFGDIKKSDLPIIPIDSTDTKDQPKDKERAALYQYWKSRKYDKEK